MTAKMWRAGGYPWLALATVFFLAPASASALDWDLARCTAFMANTGEWATYSEPELVEIQTHCDALLTGALAPPVDPVPVDPVPVDVPPADPAIVEAPPVEAPPVDPAVAPLAPPVSLAEWDFARCDAFLRDPNAPAMYSPDDLNALYPHCQNLVAAAAPATDPAIVEAPPADPVFIEAPPVDPAVAPPPVSLAEWDFARCDAFLRDPNAPAMYSPDDLNALYPHCQNLVATAAPPVDPALAAPPVDPAVVEAPADPGLLPEAALPAPVSLAEWDFARCDVFFRDPNAASMYSPDDVNAIVPHCQSITAVATPVTDPALPAGELLPPPQDPAVAVTEPGLLSTEGQAGVEGELLPPPPVDGAALPPAEGAATTEGDLLPPPTADGATLPPAEAMATTEGELLPPPVDAGLLPDPGALPPDGQAAATGDLLPPPVIEDGALMPDPALEAAVTPDAAPPADGAEGLPPVAMPGEAIVKVVITNASAVPLDVFIDPPAGGDPMFVVTVDPEYSIVQPTNSGRTWRLAQNDEWLGSIVTNAEPQQFFRFGGAQ